MILVEETDKRFYLAGSTIPDGGLGVFAAEPLKRGDYLEIIGVQVEVKSIADVCTAYAGRYKFAAKCGEDFTRVIIPMGYAGMINHENEDIRNCKLMENTNPKRNPAAGGVAYFFIRDINTDEELFGNYGGNYGQLLDWVSERTSIIEETKDDWKTLISYDIYNLKIFG